jgi:tetratricopeptide (TPR) repeat protein
MTYGQKRMVEAEQLYKQANELYQAKNFEVAFDLFKKAFDLDPLEYTYALNSGYALYENGKYEEAIAQLQMALNSHKPTIKEKSLRHIGLSYYRLGNQVDACSTFRKLLNTYPKRMYRQELQKYCGN